MAPEPIDLLRDVVTLDAPCDLLVEASPVEPELLDELLRPGDEGFLSGGLPLFDLGGDVVRAGGDLGEGRPELRLEVPALGSAHLLEALEGAGRRLQDLLPGSFGELGLDALENARDPGDIREGHVPLEAELLLQG